MPMYTTLADAVESEFQNVQELSRVWGDIQRDVARFDAELVDAYAVLGEYDFQFTYAVEDEETAMKVAMAIERNGLDTETYQVMHIDRFGELVDDV